MKHLMQKIGLLAHQPGDEEQENSASYVESSKSARGGALT
jgi:hypothetical protein